MLANTAVRVVLDCWYSYLQTYIHSGGFKRSMYIDYIVVIYTTDAVITI